VNDSPPTGLDPDERAAVRAFLQRAEVRLSTVHRVATALLSGAGLMVLLPVVGRDAVAEVIRHIFTGTVDVPHVLLGVAVLVAFSVPVVSLVMVFRDLTEFYFHATHVQHAGEDTFAPRFTLTGLRLPADELGSVGRATLARERSSAGAVELLVPDNDAARARIDARMMGYGDLGVRPRGDVGKLDDDDGLTRSEPEPVGADAPGMSPPGRSRATAGDLARAEALFVLAASRDRMMLEEVAKVEYGLVRHVMRIQTIVLRYVKALFALLTTALAIFGAAAVVTGKPTIGAADDAWLAAIWMLWAPVVVMAVSTPVRWLDGLLRREGATANAVGHDMAFTQVEDVSVRLALASYVAALAAMVWSLADDAVAGTGRFMGLAVGLVTAGLLVYTLRIWGGGDIWQRVVARSGPSRGRPTRS